MSQYYDNLIAKLVVWGKDRPTAIARTISALEETKIEGVATTIPADLAILAPPRLRQRRALDEVGRGTPRPLGARRAAGRRPPATAADEAPPLVQRRTTVEVNGKRFDVTLWVPDVATRAARPAAAAGVASCATCAGAAGHGQAGAAGSGNVTVPMQGTIVKVLVEVGQQVEAGQAVVVLEAMKMENQISAERDGTVTEIKVAAGDTVGGGDVVAVIE